MFGRMVLNKVIITFRRHRRVIRETLNCSSSTHRREKSSLAHFEKSPEVQRNEDDEHTSSRPTRRLLVENNTTGHPALTPPPRLKPSRNVQLKARNSPFNRSDSVPEDNNERLSATQCCSNHYGHGGFRPDPCSTSPTIRWRISGPSTEEKHDIHNWKLAPTSFRWYVAN